MIRTQPQVLTGEERMAKGRCSQLLGFPRKFGFKDQENPRDSISMIDSSTADCHGISPAISPHLATKIAEIFRQHMGFDLLGESLQTSPCGASKLTTIREQTAHCLPSISVDSACYDCLDSPLQRNAQRFPSSTKGSSRFCIRTKIRSHTNHPTGNQETTSYHIWNFQRSKLT